MKVSAISPVNIMQRVSGVQVGCSLGGRTEVGTGRVPVEGRLDISEPT